MTIRPTLSLRHTLVVFTLLSSLTAFNKDFYWINNSGSWNDPNHWSTISGGNSAGEIPGSGDHAIFDNNSFSTYFPQVIISDDAAVGKLFLESKFFPVLTGENVTLTIHAGFTASALFDIQLGSTGELFFNYGFNSTGVINTFGVQINSNIRLQGDWELANHLLAGSAYNLSIGGTLKSNGYTLHANQIIADAAFDHGVVDLDLSNSHVYGFSSIDFTEARSIGNAPTHFRTTEGPLSIGEKPLWEGSDIVKVTVICPNPPFQLDLNVTSNYNGQDISCFDSCDGELTIVASGTPGPFSYSFNSGTGPFTSQTVYPGLCAGNVTITVKDSSQQLVPGLYAQCSISENVAEPGILVFNPPFVVQPTCPSICDGQAFSFPSGGTAPLTVLWMPSGETTPNPVGLCTGINDVTLTDANGCTLLDQVVINNPPPIDPDPTITLPTCNGDCDAEISLNPSGGNGGPYTFTWTTIPTTSGQGSNPGIGFCAGNITVSIFDQDGCQLDTVITVVNPPLLTITAVFGANSLCFGGACTGSATSNPAGGTGGYSFEWFDNTTGLTTGLTDQNPNTLCPGTYYVVVTDAGGCIAQSNTITITSPPAITVTATAYDMSCFDVCDGAADVDVAGGVGGFTYNWVNLGNGSNNGASDSISGLCEAQYEISGTDANGCPWGPDTVEVIEPPAITLMVSSTNPTCYDLCDGTAQAVAGGGVGGYTYLWLPAPGAGQGTANVTGLCDQAYDVTVTDANGCDITDGVTLVNPPLFDITTMETDLLCFGDVNGTAGVVVNSGGSGAGYTYNWAPGNPAGDGTPNVTGLSAGVWSVTIDDALGCDTVIFFTITSPAQLTANAGVISQVSCNGDCNGSAQVVIAGGTLAYTILWDDGQSTLVASGLCPGPYVVDVTDANGCTATDNVMITEPGPFVLDTTWTNLLCFDDCDASATVTMFSGGSPLYNILWDDPLNQTTFTAFNLCVGTWTATVTDQNLCDTVISFTITEPTEIIVGTNVINSACFGVCSGAANVTAAGGTGTLTFQWYDAATDLPIAGATNDSITSLCPGDYYCIVSDGNGCDIQSADITITELPQIVTAIVSVTDATCGVCDGAAEVSAVGGAGGFEYTWAPVPGTGQLTSSVTGLCAGVYAVSIVDDAGCTANLAIPINTITLEIMTLDSVDASCFGVCDGQAIATYTSLDPPYTVEWFDNSTGLTTGIVDNPAANPSTATGLCNGTYLAVLTNVFGCVTTGTIVVNEPPQITAVLTPTNVTCNGDCDGMLDAVAAGGAGGFSYNWAPMPGSGQGTPNAGGLCDGNYTVTVTDMTGCSEDFVGTIAEPVLLVINSSTSTDISCFGANDGTANVAAAGGIPPLTYEWFDCNTGLTTGITTALASNLGPGTYQVVVTDFNGCSVTGPCLPVVEPPSLTATINTSTVNCFGNCDGLMDAVPGGGTAPYFFQWQDEFGAPEPGQTNDTMNNVCQGIYNVEITDFEGCSITFGPIDMTAPATPWIINTASTNITCSGSCDGTATVVVLGGNNPPYTYQWDDPLLQVVPGATNLCAGVVNVLISDAGICDTTVSFTITDNNPLIANVAITNVLCFGECTGSITANPFGGVGPYTMTWSDGQLGATASGLCAGPITLTITDGNGCTLDTTITITEPAELVANSVFPNNSTCGVCNASATVNIGGGVPAYTYDWVPDPPAGEGTNNASGLCAGVVTCNVTDQNGCLLVITFPISDINGEVVAVNFTDETCFGACDGTADAVFACGDPACTQEWYDASTGLTTGITSTSISNLCAGDYFVEVINNSACVTVTTVTIGGPTQITDNATLTPVTCNNDSDGSIVLAPTGGSGVGYTYTWNPVPPNGQGTNSALNIGPGVWDVDITDSDGCTESYSYTVINPTPIDITPTVTNPSCFGVCNGSISVNVAGGYGGFTYQWTNNGVPIVGETGPLIMFRSSEKPVRSSPIFAPAIIMLR
jgi:hypothetical protein